MTSAAVAPVPITAQRAWGIAAVAIAALSLLQGVLVVVLTATVDPAYGWLLVFVTIPLAVVGGVVALLAGGVGIVYARVRRRAYRWPAAGIALGVLLVAAVGLIFMPFALF